MSPSKLSVHSAYIQFMERKINLLQKDLNDLMADAEGETKSSAGDKHETGRAMLQAEQARLGKQLSDMLMLWNSLREINPNHASDRISRGSAFRTPNGIFYMCVGLGKLEVEGVTITALSPQSPLGALFMGKRQGESATLNGVVHLIEELA